MHLSDRCKMVKEKELPFGPLRYLYVGSKSAQKDLDYYTKVLGAEKVWDISSSGTRVAAVRLGKGPLVLLADHRPAGSCIMIFQVKSLRFPRDPATGSTIQAATHSPFLR